MNTFERVRYRQDGGIRTATLRNPTESTWQLSGTRVDGHGDEIRSIDKENFLSIHVKRSLISRTPLRMNAAGTNLEPFSEE
jgi:hypothetical protein